MSGSPSNASSRRNARALGHARRAALSILLPAVLGAAAFGAATVAGATLYKWTDANGRVVYSDQPPPPNVKSTTVTAPPPGDPNALKELLQKDAEARQRKAQRAEAETKAAQADANAQTRREQCVQVRGQIGQLSASQELAYRYNDKGERVVLDDAARRASRERMQAWVRENCAD
jgi:hypothetical protein